MTSAPPTTRAELIGRYEVGSPQWHATRDGALGGSDMAAVLQLSKWESPFSLWHRKKGTIGPQAENAEMHAGKRLEGAICDEWLERHPEWSPVLGGTYRHPQRRWQIANPDLLLIPACPPLCECDRDLEPVAGFEAKFALYPDEWGDEHTDDIPIYYKIQTRHYLDVFGFDRWYLMVFIGACGEFREYVIERDEADQALLRERGEAFMNTLTDGPRPTLDGHSATYQAIKALHPTQEDTNVEIPGPLAIEYEAACQQYAEIKTAKRAAAAAVLDAIGNGRAATCDGHLIATRLVYGDPDDPTIALRPAKTATRGKK